MNKKINIYDYLLSMFVSNNETRQNMQKVFPQGEFYCATDGYSLCYIPKNLCGISYDKPEKHPDINPVLDHLEHDTEISITKEDLLAKYQSCHLKWKSEYKKCDKCKGKGKTECVCCRHENDCDDCDGSGVSEEIVPFSKMEITSEGEIKFANRLLNSAYLNRVIMVAYMLNAEIIKCKYSSENLRNPLLFEINECNIILMPIIL